MKFLAQVLLFYLWGVPCLGALNCTYIPTKIANRFQVVSDVMANPDYISKVNKAFQNYLAFYLEELKPVGLDAPVPERQQYYKALEARSELFKKVLEKEFGGEIPFKILDTPAFMWKAITLEGKEVSLPAHLLRAFNTDHHGPLLRFDQRQCLL